MEPNLGRCLPAPQLTWKGHTPVCAGWCLSCQPFPCLELLARLLARASGLSEHLGSRNELVSVSGVWQRQDRPEEGGGGGCVTVEGERAGGVAALIIKAMTPQPVSSCREPLQVLETQRSRPPVFR